MKILVAIKPYIYQKVDLATNQCYGSMEAKTTSGVLSTSSFHYSSLRMGMDMRKSGTVSEVVAISIGKDAACRDVLSEALNLGVDRAIHIPIDGDLEPFSIAKLLLAIASREQSTIVICGKAGDDDSEQTAQLLAAMSNAAHVVIDRASDWRAPNAGASEHPKLNKLVAVLTCGGDSPFGNLQLPRSTECAKDIRTIDVTHLGVDIAPRLRRITLVSDSDHVWSAAFRKKMSPENPYFWSENSDVRKAALVVLDSELEDEFLSTPSAFGAAESLGCAVDVLAGKEEGNEFGEAVQDSSMGHANRVFDEFGPMNSVEIISSSIEKTGRRYSYILFSDTSEGRRLAIGIAASIAVAPILDVCGVVNENTFDCLHRATSSIRRIQTRDPVVVATVRSQAFRKESSIELNDVVWNWQRRRRVNEVRSEV